jgi:tRNA A-37 threonylcarbamoyl transferase component Bud32
VDRQSACPDETELCDLAQGTITEERGAVLRDHIGDCQACRVAVAELTSTATRASAGVEDAEREPGRYELLRLLGAGGMGEVFRARDNVLGRDVAIKLLHEDLSSPDSLADSRRRLLREARALARFVHPNVVGVYDVGVLDGRAFLAMEFVPGPTVRQWIAQFNPELSRVLDVLVQAGQGLLAAHEAGLVHRDFKPDNVLVGEDGRAKVTDFGLARQAPVGAAPAQDAVVAPRRLDVIISASSATIDGVICGTPAYMAPEQLQGVPADARSDQYAFAVTLYEAIHGKRPGATQDAPRESGIDPVAPTVPVASRTNTPTAGASVRDAPLGARPARGKRTRLDRIDKAIERALSPDPSARFPSMLEFLAAVESARDSSARRGTRALFVGLAAALVSLVLGTVLFVRRAGHAGASASPAELHAPCGGSSSLACPSPLVCRYAEGNFCGASGRTGTCVWPADGCDAKSTEVCGCDGVTYVNQCEANRQGSSTGYRGSCVACAGESTCADVTAGGARTPTFCREGNAASAGKAVCWPRPSSCDAAGTPVCAWDGRTYPSECEARRAGSDVQHPGPCPSDVGEHRAVATGEPPLPTGLTFGAPDEVGVDARPLLRLAEWIETEKLPLYSLLISKDGVVVFELYTSSLTREEAHYVMGATGAVVSALTGIAIDKHVLRSPETPVSDALPPELFPNGAARENFRRVTVRDVLGMSALDAPIPPQDSSEAAKERQRQFLASPNRVEFALSQPLLPDPGTSYQGNAISGQIATGILEYATRTTTLELAEKWLFGPMGFAHYEWMHQDKAGIDNGEYGLRLRPVDMQKFGLLFLSGGVYGGERLVSSDWVLRSFSPSIKSSPSQKEPNFGLHWWRVDYGPARDEGGHKWTAHIAEGWKGQRIAVFPDSRVVVSMTGVIEPPEDEGTIFRRVVRDYVIPAVDGTGASPARPDPSLRTALAQKLEEVRKLPLPFKRPPEARMVPSIEPHETHHGFHPE